MTTRTAFIQTSALGDVLLATAVLNEYRRLHRDERLTWIVFDQYRDAIRDNPDLDDYIAWPLDHRRKRAEQEMAAWDEMFKYARHHFDKVVCPQCYPFHDWSRKPGVHLLDQMFEYAGLEPPRERKIILSSKGDYPIDRRRVTITRKSNTQPDFFQDADWDRLEGHIRRIGYHVLYADDPDEYSIHELKSLIESSGCHIGVDSGGSWIAAATNTPQIVLYGANTVCPRWLTGITGSGLKLSHIVRDVDNASPDGVIKLILNMIGDRNWNVGDMIRRVAGHANDGQSDRPTGDFQSPAVAS